MTSSSKSETGIGVIYNASDLRRIAEVMDVISRQDERIRLEGEAYVIDRRKIWREDGEIWDTTVEFFRSTIDGRPVTDERKRET